MSRHHSRHTSSGRDGDGGGRGGGGVVMVAQRSGTGSGTGAGTKREDSQAASKSASRSTRSARSPSGKDGGGHRGDRAVDQDKKRMSVAGGMWDSFESESASEDNEDDEEPEDDAKGRRSRQRRGSNSNNSNNSSASLGSNSRNNNRREPSSHDGGGRDGRYGGGGGERRKSAPTKRSKDKLASDRESDKKGTGSFGGGSESHSDSDDYSVSGGSNARRSKRRGLSKGDSVVIHLSSGEKAKGTISRESSTTKGRYDVKLDNGDSKKNVSSRDITSHARHRRGANNGTSDRNNSIRAQSSVRERWTSSRNSASSGRRSSDSGSRSPPQRRRSSLKGVIASPSSSRASAKDAVVENQPSGGPVSPLSPDALAATPKGEGGEPGLQSPREGPQDDDVAAPGGKGAGLDASGSERDDDTGHSVGERSGSGRSSSPITRKVRQAQGLLKTMFWKKGEERSGEEHRRSSSGGSARRWPRMDSISRRFSTDSGDHGGMDSGSALSSCDDVGREKHRTPPHTQQALAHRGTASIPGDSDGDGGDRSKADTPTGANSAPSENAAASVGHARRLSRGLVRGRSRNRNGEIQNSASQSPKSRSPSLANKLGVSLRGAIMGTTRLGVHRPHVDQTSATASPADSGSDGEGTQGTYSTGASTQRRQQRRQRRPRVRSASGLKRHDDASRGTEEVVAYSSDGFDADLFSQNSPLAPTTYAGDPKNLPDAVSSYIGARERIEHETSASGPVFLPRSDNLAQGSGSGDGILGRAKRRGSLDITKGAASTTQRSEQNQPFTEAMFKAGVSETRHSTKQGILLEGDLQKFSPESMRGVRWHKRYFVLYACACELRYYRTHAEAAWGRIPLGERGSIPLRLVVKIEQPSDKKYRGCRFDLVVLHKGDGRHPGLHIRPGHESRVVTTKTFKFNAADAQQRLLWVTVIEALMKKHGWGLDADRRRNMRAPRHGGPSAAASDSLWGGAWGGEAETEVSGEHSRRDVVGREAGRSARGSQKAGSYEDLPVTNTSDLRCDSNGRAEPPPGSRKNSVLAFVEEGDGAFNSLSRTEPARQRGIRIPYSPQGRRGSLTTEALSPPVPTCGGARRQSSLKSDLRPMKYADLL